MTRVAVTFGLIAGAIVAMMMIITMPLYMSGRMSFDNGEIFGYTTMLLAFIMIFVGIRMERERRGGTITFGQAFKTGLVIAAIASVVYVATWEVLYFTMYPDFGDKYAQYAIEKVRASGASAAAVQAETAKMEQFKVWYGNPLLNIGMTFLEIFPLGLIVAAISSAILRRRQPLEPQVA